MPIAEVLTDAQPQESAMRYLDGVARNFSSVGVRMGYRTLKHVGAAHAILSTADDSGADLIDWRRAEEARSNGS